MISIKDTIKNPCAVLKAQLHLIEHQISKIDEEIKIRKQVSEKTIRKLKDRLDSYLKAMNKPYLAADLTGERDFVRARGRLNHMVRETQYLISLEERSFWSDIQRLKWEKRQLKREKIEMELSLKLLSRNRDST